mmetsp:Transcript_108226/g.183171  ORF Transcript_108226/g.183171 Transcript_108226/m.183171 type:complete len:113 (-) Transcript_108226:1485-1823(-)
MQCCICSPLALVKYLNSGRVFDVEGTNGIARPQSLATSPPPQIRRPDPERGLPYGYDCELHIQEQRQSGETKRYQNESGFSKWNGKHEHKDQGNGFRALLGKKEQNTERGGP